jgi:hypothetical protein
MIECPICYDNVKVECITECGHTFCKACMDRWFRKGHMDCPLCRSRIQAVVQNGIHYTVQRVMPMSWDHITCYRYMPYQYQVMMIGIVVAFMCLHWSETHTTIELRRLS